jgi:hypothetical protein
MRFFGFFKANDSDLPERIKNRWKILSNGFIIDSKMNDNLVWKININFFEDFFSGIEVRSGQSLGRRLAHASSESEEWLMSASNVKPPNGKDPKKWKDIRHDWEERGLGLFELVDDGQEIRIHISHPINGPMCAGIFSAIWEYSTKSRFRFRWNQNTSESLMLSLSEDSMVIPKPSGLSIPWFNRKSVSSSEIDHEFWDTLQTDDDGTWSIMGDRMAMINQDLILRFESYFLPHVDGIHEGREGSYLWHGLDEKKSFLWTIFSDTTREIFFNRGYHVIISKEQDWIVVGKRHLSRNGLGTIDSVNSIDNSGGIEIYFSSCFHPAIFCGVLSGCWERAYGRNVKSEFRVESDKNVLKLISMTEIAR